MFARISVPDIVVVTAVGGNERGRAWSKKQNKYISIYDEEFYL